MYTIAAPANLFPVISTHRNRSYTTTKPSRFSCPKASIFSSISTTPPPSQQNPKILSKNNFFVSTKSLVISAATGTFSHLGGGIFGGRGVGGGGGGEGGGSGNFWSHFFSLSGVGMAIANDEDPRQEWDSHGLPANINVQLNRLSAFKKFKVSDILFLDRRSGSTSGTEDFFFEMMSLRPGGVYNKTQFERELENLATCGMFDKVELLTKTNPDGTISFTIPFVESTWRPADRFRCINVALLPQPKPVELDPDMTQKEILDYQRSLEKDYRKRIERSRPCMLPDSVQEEIQEMLREQDNVSARMLQKIRDKVQNWYHENGFVLSQVVNFGNLHTKEVVCEVVEGEITGMAIKFQDKLGNVCEGHTKLPLIRREMPKQFFSKGQVFNIEAGRLAVSNLNSLDLFSNIDINPRPDEKNEGGMIVEINLKEKEQKSAEVSTEWSIVPDRGGRPTLASIQPGGTISIEHRNINGLNRSFLGSMTTSNFLNTPDDLAFKLEYVHPYVDGINNPRNRTFRTSIFNSKKLSPVFTGGPGIEEVPPIWVDRAGIKATITENLSSQSKFTYGLVMEEITTRDESNHISANGLRALPSGGVSTDGPPTTLSGTGVDRMAFLQANITRDNTKLVNGALVGGRNVFQLDQGLGIGSKFPSFNRHQLTVTQFLQLKNVEEGVGKPPPPVLVLHGHYGGCVGDLPSYDAFTIGGPYSVRGYNMGELGAARNKLELAAELRIPIRNNTQAYVFAEHGNDLGSSKDVKGNPTEVYRRMGHGSSYGVGVKLGPLRAEYAVDHNSGTGAVFFRYGERF